MWDSPSQGTFFSYIEKDPVIQSKVAALSTEKLMEFVALYESWKEDGQYDKLYSFICKEVKDYFDRNTLSNVDENFKIYDIACRELAKRYLAEHRAKNDPA